MNCCASFSFERGKMPGEQKHESVFCCQRVAHIATCQHSGWDWKRKRWQQSNSFKKKLKSSKMKPCLQVLKLTCWNSTKEMFTILMWNVNLDWKKTTEIHNQNSWRKAWQIAIFNSRSLCSGCSTFPLLNEPNFPSQNIRSLPNESLNAVIFSLLEQKIPKFYKRNKGVDDHALINRHDILNKTLVLPCLK